MYGNNNFSKYLKKKNYILQLVVLCIFAVSLIFFYLNFKNHKFTLFGVFSTWLWHENRWVIMTEYNLNSFFYSNKKIGVSKKKKLKCSKITIIIVIVYFLFLTQTINLFSFYRRHVFWLLKMSPIPYVHIYSHKILWDENMWTVPHHCIKVKLSNGCVIVFFVFRRNYQQ